jgi:hypothetical protein
MTIPLVNFDSKSRQSWRKFGQFDADLHQILLSLSIPLHRSNTHATDEWWGFFYDEVVPKTVRPLSARPPRGLFFVCALSMLLSVSLHPACINAQPQKNRHMAGFVCNRLAD